MRFIVNKAGLTEEQAKELLFAPRDKIALDIETVSIENVLPLGVGIALSKDLGFYFFNPKDPTLKQAIEGVAKVYTHNAKFDIALLRSLGIKVQGYEDTKMLAYSAGILDNTLEDLARSQLFKECPSVTSLWRKPNQGNVAIDHIKLGQICITHACLTYELGETLKVTPLYLEIDKPCIELLMEMEAWGVLIDQYALTLVEQDVANIAFPLEVELKKELAVENLASNPQVAKALQNKGIIGTRKTKGASISVSDESLGPLNLPLTNKLLQWRSLTKTLSTYVPAFRTRIDQKGRIHTRFGYTRTGRWSCVPLESKILTARGWKSYDELILGERVIGYNIFSSKLEWTKLKSVFVGEGELGEFSWRKLKGHRSYTESSSFVECSPEHRWVVSYKNLIGYLESKDLGVDGRSFTKTILWASGAEGTYHNPTEAGIIGWAITDGYPKKLKSGGYNLSIRVVKPTSISYLEDLLRDTPHTRHSYYNKGKDFTAVDFYLGIEFFTPIMGKILAGVDKYILASDYETRLSMYNAMMEGDGSPRRSSPRFGAQKETVIEAFGILATVLGKGVSYSKRKTGFTDINLRHQLLKPKNTRFKRTGKVGKIWCPTTELNTWVMLQKGSIVITGNSSRPNLQNITRNERFTLEEEVLE